MIEEVTEIAPWIQTLLGNAFDFEDMQSNEFDALEVADVLSRIPRFAGHTKWPYTVAQHCCLVARCFFDHQQRLAAILHDATEAYIGDVSAPLKHWLKNQGGTTALKKLETRIWDWIAAKHDLTGFDMSQVRFADMQALATEARDLMMPHPRPWCEMPTPWKEPIEPWCAQYARDQWFFEYQHAVEKIAYAKCGAS